MLLLDFSQTIFGQVFTDLKRNGNGEIKPELIRHLVLNQICSFNNKFKSKYGQMVICIDSRKQYWRKQEFAYYKFKRGQDRKASDLNWGELFESMNMIRDEVIEEIPLLTFEVDHMEADDLISALIRYPHEKHIIVSSDNDFQQLQIFPNVAQYSPLTQKLVKCADPEGYLEEHIIRGDKGDGIPNIRAPADFFYRKSLGEDARQPAITKKFLRTIEEELENDSELKARWKQNRGLVDLVHVPEKHLNTIYDEFERRVSEFRQKNYNLYKYMMKNRLRILMENIHEFANDNSFPCEKHLVDNENSLEEFMS